MCYKHGTKEWPRGAVRVSEWIGRKVCPPPGRTNDPETSFKCSRIIFYTNPCIWLQFQATVNQKSFCLTVPLFPNITSAVMIFDTVYEWNDCINMLLVIDTLRRADCQVFFFFPPLPAAELETFSSVSRLMNAAPWLPHLSSPQANVHLIASKRSKHGIWSRLSKLIWAIGATQAAFMVAFKRRIWTDLTLFVMLNPGLVVSSCI